VEEIVGLNWDLVLVIVQMFLSLGWSLKRTTMMLHVAYLLVPPSKLQLKVVPILELHSVLPSLHISVEG